MFTFLIQPHTNSLRLGLHVPLKHGCDASVISPKSQIQLLLLRHPSAGRPSLAGFAGQAIRPLMASFLFSKKEKQMGDLKARCSDF